MPYCPNCGYRTGPDDRFCEQCGDRLRDTASVDTEEREESDGYWPSQANGRFAPDANAGEPRRRANGSERRTGADEPGRRDGTDARRRGKGPRRERDRQGTARQSRRDGIHESWGTPDSDTAGDQWRDGPTDMDRGQPASDPPTRNARPTGQGQRPPSQGRRTPEHGQRPTGHEKRRSDERDRSDAGTFRRGDGLDVALRYPIGDGYAEVLKGGILVLIGFLVVPLIVLAGYSVALGKAAARGRRQQPTLADWGELLVDGLRVSALAILVGGIGGGVLWAISTGVGRVNETAAAFAWLAAAIVVGYLSVAVLTVFVGSDSLRTTLTTRQVVDLATTTFFLKACLKYALLGIVLYFMVVLSFITIVGWLFAIAYAIMAVGAFWGYTYHEAGREGIVPRVTPDDPEPGDRPRRDGREAYYW